MRVPWNSDTKPALLFTLAVMMFGAIIWVQDNTSDVARGDFWEKSAEEYADGETEALDSSIDRTINSVERFSPVATGSGGSVLRSTPQPEQNPILVAKRLSVEMRQIIRAGRSMKSLRCSTNDILLRRCRVGMNKLERWINSVAERERRLALPESVSPMRDVFTYAKICTSCRSNASDYCVLAEKALSIVNASLGI